MNELQNEFATLQKLQSEGALDDTQSARFAELPNLINTEKTVADEKIKKDLESALAQKDHFRTKFEKEEADRKALEQKLNNAGQGKALDVNDYIDISASLEGLDQRQKSYLAEQHKLTGKTLKELRESEDFQLWSSAYVAKVEKEKLALKPSGTQIDSDKPKTLTERLAGASLAEKEQILTEAGLWKSPRPRSDRSVIGGMNFPK